MIRLKQHLLLTDMKKYDNKNLSLYSQATEKSWLMGSHLSREDMVDPTVLYHHSSSPSFSKVRSTALTKTRNGLPGLTYHMTDGKLRPFVSKEQKG